MEVIRNAEWRVLNAECSILLVLDGRVAEAAIQHSELRIQHCLSSRVSTHYRALNGAGQAGVDPVAGKAESLHRGRGGRAGGLSWRERERGPLLSDDGTSKETVPACRGDCFLDFTHRQRGQLVPAH